MITTATGKNNCPVCKKEIGCTSSTYGNAIPVPKDVTVCFYCSAILQFTSDMDLQEVPKVVFESFDRKLQRKIRHIQDAIRSINKNK